jgi:Pentapeptide repeats (8 copies)
MADQSHLDILKEGVEAWNEWRERNPSIDPDLSGANLSRAYLYGASPLMAALSEDSRYGVNLSATTLNAADLTEAWLIDANLFGAALFRANLSRAALSEANLSDADLTRSALVETNLTGTTLTACHIYGISAWDLKLEGAKQHNLNVSNFGEPAIMVDNLEVAQFIYLLLNNEKIRQVIDTITSKVVLILGRFTSERKAVLDAIRDSLRQRDYLPVLFDFDKPASRDLTESISTLAHMARFIIADITHAKSIPQELQAIVPNLPSVPVQPLLLKSESEYGMFESIKRFPWVLDTYYYDNLDAVLASVEDNVISPAETKARELSS